MFHQTRLTLTAWYLLIIMGISILFSLAFYNVTTQEVQRLIDRMEHQRQDPFDMHTLSPQFTQQRIQDLQESKQRLLWSLIFLNGIVFIVAGGGGYFLAGRTLRPIQHMVTDQNRFITDASHELRTPLTATRTSIEVALRDKQLTLADAKKVLEGNLEDITSIQVLSDNLLRLSQFEKVQESPPSATISLAEVIDTAVRKITPLARAKNITMTQKVARYPIKGNAQNFEELFLIFLDNAIKYSPKGSSVTISTQKTDGHVNLTIQDNGIGIEKEDIPSIFDRFYRAEKSRTKNKVTGYGLGLSIAKKIIEEHKGTVSVTSVVGKGTTFTLSFPTIS